MSEPNELPGMYHLVANSQLISEHQIDGHDTGLVSPFLEQPSSYSEPQLRSLQQPTASSTNARGAQPLQRVSEAGHRPVQNFTSTSTGRGNNSGDRDKVPRISNIII